MRTTFYWLYRGLCGISTTKTFKKNRQNSCRKILNPVTGEEKICLLKFTTNQLFFLRVFENMIKYCSQKTILIAKSLGEDSEFLILDFYFR